AAVEQKPDDVQYYCQRAFCHIFLGHYCDVVAHVKKSQEFNPNNSSAMLKKRDIMFRRMREMWNFQKKLSALVKLHSGEDYNMKLRISPPILPEQSTLK
ncbi:Protein SGT1, partial [Galemys pyrenaicus]